MPLPAGTRLGPYEILAPLGAGGMGEVYRARDTKLDRLVALKVLPPHLASNPEALARFEREAKAVASLSHPNILAIHDFGVAGGTAYSVTELLEGETLRATLGGSALPHRKAVEIALQIASGLAAAHERGLVHRDLKPDNLFVTRDGRVKILDFGLAKSVAPDPARAAGSIATGATQTPTLEAGTQPGMVMGTVGYMSPEQARGMTLDHRTDIFSFGAVLYEMLSGARAFRGATPADTMSAILKEDPPDLASSGRSFPPGLERIVRHCLEKNPEQRFQSARDVAFALESLSGLSSTGAQAAAAAPAETARPRRLLFRAAAAAILAGALAGAYFLGSHAGRGGTERNVTFRQLTFRPQAIFRAASMPDGATIVFSAALQGNQPDLFTLRPENPEPIPLGAGAAHLLDVSSKGELAVLVKPAYLAHSLFEGTLARMPLGGGAPREILQDVREADWSPDGSDLAIIRDVGGKDRLEFPAGKILSETSGYFSDLRFSPRGDRIALFEHPVKYDDRGSIALVDLRGNKKVLSDGYWGLEGIAWATDGGEIYFSGGTGYSSFTIYAVSPEGTVRPALQSAGGLTIHAVLPDGRWLVTREELQRGMLALPPGVSEERDVSWLELSEPAALSADGRTLLFSEEGVAAGVNYATCLRGTDGSPVVRLGEGAASDLSPDARWALSIIPSDPMQAVLYPTGAGEPRRLERGGIEQYVSGGWLPDGKSVLLCGSEAKHAPRCYVQDVAGGAPHPVTPEGTSLGVVSPDGRQVLAQSASGEWALYPIAGGEGTPVPALHPDESVSRWTRDGRSVIEYQRSSMPARIEQVDLATGKRTLFKEIAPPDRAGALGVTTFALAADERSYAYGVRRQRSTLYLVVGAR